MLATAQAYGGGEWELFDRLPSLDGKGNGVASRYSGAEVLSLFPTQDEAAASFIGEWLERFYEEQHGWTSNTLYAEMRLKEAAHLTAGLEPPCNFVSSVACAMLAALVPTLGSRGAVVQELTAELFRSIFIDYDTVLHSDAVECRSARSLLRLDPRFFRMKSYASVARQLRIEVAELRQSLAVVDKEDGVLQEEIRRRRQLFRNTISRWEKGIASTAFRIWKHTMVGNRKARKNAISAIRRMWKHKDNNLRACFHAWRTTASALRHARLRRELKECRAAKTRYSDMLVSMQLQLDKSTGDVKRLEETYSTQRRKLAERTAVHDKLQRHLQSNRLGEAKRQALAWVRCAAGLMDVLLPLMAMQVTSVSVGRVDGTLLREDPSTHRFNAAREASGSVEAGLAAALPSSAVASMTVRSSRRQRSVDVFLPPPAYAALHPDGCDDDVLAQAVNMRHASRQSQADALASPAGSPPRPAAVPSSPVGVGHPKTPLGASRSPHAAQSPAAARSPSSRPPMPRRGTRRSHIGSFRSIKGSARHVTLDNCPAPATTGITPRMLVSRQQSSRRGLFLLDVAPPLVLPTPPILAARRPSTTSPLSGTTVTHDDDSDNEDAPLLRVRPCLAYRDSLDGAISITQLYSGRLARQQVANLAPSSVLLRWVNYVCTLGAPHVHRDAELLYGNGSGGAMPTSDSDSDSDTDTDDSRSDLDSGSSSDSGRNTGAAAVKAVAAALKSSALAAQPSSARTPHPGSGHGGDGSDTPTAVQVWNPMHRVATLGADIKDGRLLAGIVHGVAPTVFDPRRVHKLPCQSSLSSLLELVCTDIRMLINAGMEVHSSLVPRIRLSRSGLNLPPLVLPYPSVSGVTCDLPRMSRDDSGRSGGTGVSSSTTGLGSDAGLGIGPSAEALKAAGMWDDKAEEVKLVDHSKPPEHPERIDPGLHALAVKAAVDRTRSSLEHVAQATAGVRPRAPLGSRRTSFRRAARMSILVGKLGLGSSTRGMPAQVKPPNLEDCPPLIGPKDVYQGNAVWAAAAVSQLLSTFPCMYRRDSDTAAERAVVQAVQATWKEVAPMGGHVPRWHPTAPAAHVSASELSDTRRKLGKSTPEEAALLSPNGNDELTTSSLLETMRQTVAGGAQALDFAEAEVLASEHAWAQAASLTQEGCWHRITSAFGNTSSVKASGATKRPFGRAGSRRLVDPRQPWFCSIKYSRISDVLRLAGNEQSNFADVNALLDRHASVLEVLFTYYARLSTPGAPARPKPGQVQIVDHHNFWRFVKDARLLSDSLLPADVDYIVAKASREDDSGVDAIVARHADPRNPRAPVSVRKRLQPGGRPARGRSTKGRSAAVAAAVASSRQAAQSATLHTTKKAVNGQEVLCLGPVQFVEAVVRLGAVGSVKSKLVDRVKDMLSTHIMPMVDDPSLVRSPFRTPDMVRCLISHHPTLLALFKRYSVKVLVEEMDALPVPHPSVEVRPSAIGSASAGVSRRPSVANIMSSLTMQAGGARAAISLAVNHAAPHTALPKLPGADSADVSAGPAAAATGGSTTSSSGDGAAAGTDMLGSHVIMSLSGWLAFAAAHGLRRGRLTADRLKQIFTEVQPDPMPVGGGSDTDSTTTAPSGLVFTEFCEAVASAALVLKPDPFVRPHMTVHFFIADVSGK